MKAITFRGVEFDSAGKALQHSEAAGGQAILLDARNFVMTEAEVTRIATAGVEFAHLVEHETADGVYRIMTIPVN